MATQASQPLSILEAERLSKKFGSFTALEGVSLKIRSATIHALVGENGAGKTTLLKHFFGFYQPTSGAILFEGVRVKWQSPLEAIAQGIGMVQQHFTLVNELSALDNIILGSEPCRFGKIQRAKAIEQIEELIPSPFLRVSWSTLVKDLSVGERQKVEILKVLFRKPKVIILDEPTAVLSPHEVESFFQVLNGLKERATTVVIVTHKLNEVFALADEFSVLRLGRLVGSGTISQVSKEQVVELMIGHRPKPRQELSPRTRNDVLLKCQNLSEMERSRGALKNVTLRVGAGEIVGVAGVEGSGQSHLVEVLLGLRRAQGSIEFKGTEVIADASQIRSQIGLVPEDRRNQGLWMQASSLHNLIIGLESRFATWGILRDSLIESIPLQWVGDFDIRLPSWESPMSTLSGGNQQKVILAREARGRNALFFLCHHPTRGVDLGAIELIYNELFRQRASGNGLLVLSSDLDELMTLSDRLYVLFDGNTVAEFGRGCFDRMQIGRYMTGAIKGAAG